MRRPAIVSRSGVFPTGMAERRRAVKRGRGRDRGAAVQTDCYHAERDEYCLGGHAPEQRESHGSGRRDRRHAPWQRAACASPSAAIFKNEGPYILEWVAYHRVLGIERFFIADNDSSRRDGGDSSPPSPAPGSSITCPSPRCPGRPPQLPPMPRSCAATVPRPTGSPSSTPTSSCCRPPPRRLARGRCSPRSSAGPASGRSRSTGRSTAPRAQTRGRAPGLVVERFARPRRARPTRSTATTSRSSGRGRLRGQDQTPHHFPLKPGACGASMPTGGRSPTSPALPKGLSQPRALGCRSGSITTWSSPGTSSSTASAARPGHHGRDMRATRRSSHAHDRNDVLDPMPPGWSRPPGPRSGGSSSACGSQAGSAASPPW